MRGRKFHLRIVRRLLPENFRGKIFQQDGMKHGAFRAEGWEGNL